MSVAKPTSETFWTALERGFVAHGKRAGFGAVVACTILAGWFMGPASAILVLAGGALVAVIAIFWASLRTLVGETPLSGADAYALGAPRAEEEQKQAVLRALKDLEFERSVGKISDEDYNELVAKYRSEAKRLLRLLDADAQPRRKHVESLVAKHLRSAGIWTDANDGDDEAGDDPAGADKVVTRRVKTDVSAGVARRKKKERARAAAVAPEGAGGEARDDDEDAAEGDDGGLACVACGTVNDEDAVFCKKCGKKCADSRRQPTDDDESDSNDEADSDESDNDSDDDDESAQEEAARGRRGRR